MLVDSGRARLNQIFAGVFGPENTLWCLYTNVVAWAHGTVIGDLVEAAWAGYVRGNVPLLGWSVPIADGTFDQVSLADTAIVYANSSGGPVTAKGWFVLGQASGVFYGGGPFSADLTIPAGTTVSTFPQLITNAVPTSP